MKAPQVFVIVLIFLISENVTAQQKTDSVKTKGSVSVTYLYATETSYISPREAGLIKIFYGTGDSEQNFFKTHTVHLNYNLSEKYQIGLGLKYGNNFYRSSSERRGELDNGDRDYESYLGLGVTGSLELFKFGAKKNDYPFRAKNMVSLQYIRFDGIEAEGGFQKEVELLGLFVESGVIVSYLFNDGTSRIRVFYQPLSFQVGTYGLAFQYNGFGVTIKF